MDLEREAIQEEASAVSEPKPSLVRRIFEIQQSVTGVERDSANQHFRSRYASLEAVVSTLKPLMGHYGVAFYFTIGDCSQHAEVTLVLASIDTDESIRSTMRVPLQKMDPQGVGSAITYCQRYSLMAAFGLPSVDDDGEIAVQRTSPQAQTSARMEPVKAVKGPLGAVMAKAVQTMVSKSPGPESCDEHCVAADLATSRDELLSIYRSAQAKLKSDELETVRRKCGQVKQANGWQ